MLFVFYSRISSFCSKFLQSVVDVGNTFDSSSSLRNITCCFFVDVENLVSVLLATNMILDFENRCLSKFIAS